MSPKDWIQDISWKASVPGPVCILILYSKTLTWDRQESNGLQMLTCEHGSQDFENSHDTMFQLFLHVILSQAASDFMFGEQEVQAVLLVNH